MRLPIPQKPSQAAKFQFVTCAAIALLLLGNAFGATLVWDDVPGPGNDGAQDGAGTWQDGAGNWYQESPLPVAQDQNWSNAAGNTAVFGTGGTAGPIAVSGTVNVGDIIFRPVALTSSSGSSYTFTGGASNVIAMADGSSIIIGDGTTNSSNSNGRIIFNTNLSGNDITIKKADGSAQLALVHLRSTNSLTGTLSLRSADAGGLFVQAETTVNSLPSTLSMVDVGLNTTLVLNVSGGTWTVPFTLQGSGAGSRGAIRVDAANTTLTGAITLAGDTLIMRNTNATLTTINSNIGESVAGRKLTLGTTSGVANTGTVILGGNNTFTGGLVIGVSDVRINHLGALNSSAPNVVSFSDTTAARSLSLNGLSVAVGGLVSTSTSVSVRNNHNTSATLTIATSTASSSFAGVLADGDGEGKLSVVKTGSFAQTLSGANTFSGGLTLDEGTLNVNHASALGTGTFTINGGTLGNTSGGAITNVNNNAMVWNGDFGFTATAVNTLDLGTGAVSLGATEGTTRMITVATSNSMLTVGGAITDGTTANSLTKAGDGILTLGGNNSYTGLTTVNKGILRITHGGALGSTSSGTTVASGARVQLDGNIIVNGESLITPHLENLAGDNTWNGDIQCTLGTTLTFTSTAGNLLISGNVNAEDTAGQDHSVFLAGAGNGEISGVISNSFGVNKNGSGTWILSGANTYTTATTVNAGGLQVGKGGVGQTGTGAVTVKSGASLFGTGTVRGSTFKLESGASLFAGDGIANTDHGTLTFAPTTTGNYTLAAGSTVTLSLGGATLNDASFGGHVIGSDGYNDWVASIGGTGNHDRLVFEGSEGSQLVVASNIVVFADGYVPTVGDAFNLLDWAAVLAANFDDFSVGANFRTGAEDNGTQFDLPDISAYGYYWDVSHFTTSGVLLVTPEPGRLLLLGIGFGALLMRRRRKAGNGSV